MSHTVKELVLDALEKPADERRGFLELRCADNQRALAEALEFLRHADQSHAVLDAPRGAAIVTAVREENSTFAPGDVPRHRLIDVVGEGTFGVVYKAEQFEPVRRIVAVKILKPGMNSRDILRRFGQERRAVALLNHPGIARIYDAGTTTRALPFFAMEFVEGEPITSYCDRETLSIRQRLALVAEVCHTVQHAHHKGVIHRDLKPANILVTAGDQPGGHPIVIDFGVAKALDIDAEVASGATLPGSLIGTPEYMSPEQARGEPVVDFRSDVYSLGVILCELVCGVRPFDNRGRAELVRLVADREAAAPSLRMLFASRPHEAKSIAQRRGLSPRTLRRAIGGDLNTVVAKALRKEPGDRYNSPLDLALDIQCLLDNRPARTTKPSPFKSAVKFARRHRFSSLLAVTVAIAASTAGLFWLDAARERQVSTRLANNWAAPLILMADKLVQSGKPHDLRAAAVVYDYAVQTSRDIGEPHSDFALSAILNRGVALQKLGEHAEAIPVLEEAWQLKKKYHGEQQTHTRGALQHLAQSLGFAGKSAEAELAWTELTRLLREKPSSNPCALANAMSERFRLLAKRGAFDEADLCLSQLIEEFERSKCQSARMPPFLMVEYAEVLIRHGRADKAASELHRAEQFYGAQPVPDDLAERIASLRSQF